MKRGLIFLAFFVFLFLIFANLSIIPSIKFDSNVKVDNAVYEKLQQEGKVRVFVYLKDNTKVLGARTFEKMKEATDIKSALISDFSKLPSNKFKLMHNFGGSLAVEISADVLEQLKNDMRIERIEEDLLVHAFLQDSVPLINATLVWPIKVNGVNLTGETQTVCIIDTGVNYSHPDLGGCFGNSTNFSCKVIAGYDYVNDDANPDDDNGHGTHVAGIIAANGTIVGVAPGARIVSIKVLDSAGNGYTSDLTAGVQWCADNSTVFNISVISMSLGTTTLYRSYCDNLSSALTSAIDNATARNITVVAATGNDGSTTSIANPACIRNSTAVGGTTKSDAMYSSGNRNNITTILAPGVSITSTWLTGTASASGTSMSTPHVSGAIALLKQYKKLEKNTNLTTVQIKDVLNRTGKQITDTGFSNLIYSRINVYAALLSIDETKPILTLFKPENTTYASNVSLPINFTAQDNLNLSDCLYSIDSAANVSLQNCQNSTFNTTLGSHTFTLYALDSAGNINFSSVVFYVNEAPVVNLSLPLNSTSTAAAMQTFSCNASDSSGLQNITFYVWNSTAVVHTNTSNKSGEIYNQTNFSYALPYEGVFKWNCKAYDNLSSFGWALNYTISYDTTAPNVSLIEPENGTNYTAAGNISFSFNVTDLIDIANCSLIINSALNATLTNPVRNVTNNMSIALNNAAYNWSINCTDTANNVGTSNRWQLTINVSVDYNISACRNISQAGTYRLNKSITNSGNAVCINVSASDVEIDCQTYAVDGTDIATSIGIYVQGTSASKISNITIRNCNVSEWRDGIRFEYVENSTVENNTAESNLIRGIFLNLSSSIYINHNYVNTTASGDGIMLATSTYNRLTNNTINNNSEGLFITYNSSHNRIINNTIARSVSFAITVSTWSVNNTFINNLLAYNAEGISFIEAAASDNVIINLTGMNNAGYDINITDANATIKNSVLAGYAFYNSIINLENSSYARASFPNITQNGTNLSEDVVVRYNYIFVNSTNAPGLNRSANLSFYGLSFTNPRILRDGSVCPSSICTKIAYTSSNGTLIFNVTSFSSYSAEETPTTQQTVSSGGGGGGGGTIAKTYSEGTLSEGKEINRLLEKNDKIKFTLRENEHNLTVKSVTQDNATFELNSTSLEFMLSAGESRKFNLTDEKFYDLLITLNSISNLKANLSMTAVYEMIPLQKPATENITKPKENITEQTPKAEEKPAAFNNKKVLLVTAITTCIILVILLFNFYKNLKEKRAIEKLKEGKGRHVRKKGKGKRNLS